MQNAPLMDKKRPTTEADLSRPKRQPEERAREEDRAEEGTQERDRRERQELAERNHLRDQCLHLLGEGAARKDSAMVRGDVADYASMGITEEKLRDAKDHDEKMEWLQGHYNIYIRDFVRKTVEFGRKYLDKVEAAKEGHHDDASRTRWQARLKERRSGEEWPAARERKDAELSTELPKMQRAWRRVRTEIRDIRAEASKAGLTAKQIPVLGEILSTGFKSRNVKEQRPVLDQAHSSLEHHAEQRDALVGEARHLLRRAAGAGLLDDGKVERAMAGIAAETDMVRLKRYVTQTLPKYERDWVREQARLGTARDTVREKGLATRVPTDAEFLAKGHDERTACLEMLELRVAEGVELKKEESLALAKLRKEVDQEHWDAARNLITDAGSAYDHNAEWRATARYVALQPPSPPEEQDPQAALTRVHARVKALPGPVQELYATALEEDTAGQENAFGKLRAAMDNTLQLRRNGVLTEDEEARDAETDAPEARETRHEEAATPAPRIETRPVSAPAEEETPDDRPVLAEDETPYPDDAAAPIADAEAAALEDEDAQDRGVTVHTKTVDKGGLAREKVTADVVYVQETPDAQRAAFRRMMERPEDANDLQTHAIRPAIPAGLHELLVRDVNLQLDRDARTLREHGLRYTRETPAAQAA